MWRVVEVPLAASLAALHLVIQAAIRWEESHLYEFEADGQRYGLSQPGWAISRPPSRQARRPGRTWRVPAELRLRHGR